jgi:hypothetical protein
VTDTILFAGTDAGVWRRPLSEMFTSVPPSSTDIPRKFSLEQNFPNPFNPETEISFQVPGVRDQGPGTRSVKLVVYDLLGREVATLVNEERPPGSYTVRFEASALASGVYMYRLIAGEWAGVRKMMLLK